MQEETKPFINNFIFRGFVCAALFVIGWFTGYLPAESRMQSEAEKNPVGFAVKYIKGSRVFQNVPVQLTSDIGKGLMTNRLENRNVMLLP